MSKEPEVIHIKTPREELRNKIIDLLNGHTKYSGIDVYLGWDLVAEEIIDMVVEKMVSGLFRLDG